MKITYTYRDQLDAVTRSVEAARTWTHPDYDLSSDDLATERGTRVASATAAHTGLLDQARRDVFPAAAKALADLAEQYAHPPIREAGQVADRRNRWDRTAMLAERGESLGHLIDNATRADLDAIAEWAPTWVRAEQLDTHGGGLAQGYQPNPAAWVHDRITLRYAALDPAGTAARALAKVRNALDVVTTMDHYDPLSLAIARQQLDSMSDEEALLTYRTNGHVATQTELATKPYPSLFLGSENAQAGQDTGPMEVGQ